MDDRTLTAGTGTRSIISSVVSGVCFYVNRSVRLSCEADSRPRRRKLRIVHRCAWARASYGYHFALCRPIPPIHDLGPDLAGQDLGVGVEQQKEVRREKKNSQAPKCHHVIYPAPSQPILFVSLIHLFHAHRQPDMTVSVGCTSPGPHGYDSPCMSRDIRTMRLCF